MVIFHNQPSITDVRNDNAFTNLFEYDSLDDELIKPQEVDDLGNPIIRPDVDVPTNDAPFMEQDDVLVGLKVPIARCEEVLEATVHKCKHAPDGSLLGTTNANPTLDSRLYEVEFPDGSYQDYATNTLLENLVSHVDEEGMHHAILKGIVNHKRLDTAVGIDDGVYEDSHGATRHVITTKGCQLKVVSLVLKAHRQLMTICVWYLRCHSETRANQASTVMTWRKGLMFCKSGTRAGKISLEALCIMQTTCSM